MPQLIAVDHDPFAAPTGPQLMPVDHDPFASVAGDVTKQLGAGLVSGVEKAPTAIPRMLGALGNFAEPYLESAVDAFHQKSLSDLVTGAPSPKVAEMRQAAAEQAALRDMIQQQRSPDVASYLPTPQTTAGQYAHTAAEFVPGMAAAPGNVVRNAITGVIAGLTSEAAGQATQGTAAEPYARAAGGLVGGVAGAKAVAPAASKLAIEDVKAAGTAAYKSPEVAAVQIKPEAAERISDNILGDLDRARLNDKLAPNTRAIVEDLKNPVQGNFHTLEDYQTTRQLLQEQAGNFANPTERAAASKAIAALDQHVRFMPQSDLVAGDIKQAVSTLERGRGDYAAAKAAERVQQKLDNADLQAASAYSGGNIDNATRQKLRTILTSPKASRGLSPEELDSIDQVVRGSPTGNALRVVGKLLGGGGGLGSVVTAGIGAHTLGPAGYVLPALGYGIKKAGDALTTRKANAVVQQILSRAPSAPSLTPPAAPALHPLMGGALGALLASTSLQPPFYQSTQSPYLLRR